MVRSFIFTDSASTITGNGIAESWGGYGAAISALRTGVAPLVVGAIPFHPVGAAVAGDVAAAQRQASQSYNSTPQVALFTPEEHYRSAEPLHFSSVPDSALPGVVNVRSFPTAQQHVERVAAIVAELAAAEGQAGRCEAAQLQAGGRGENKHETSTPEAESAAFNTELAKIVLSRAQEFQLDGPLEPSTLLKRMLQKSATGHGHLTALPMDAGSDVSAHPSDMDYLVGASPEILIIKRGERIYSHPLAGTISRSADPQVDRAHALELQYSEKDLTEHAYVTQDIKRVLAPYCRELEVPARPTLTATSHSWHLGTPIQGVLHSSDVPLLELVEALHPTPAIGGFPRSQAQRRLLQEEPHRGFYAGAVGWADARGDGEWRVTIRSATVHNFTGGAMVRAHAGSGIVASSSPVAEMEETRTKFGPVRSALGLPTGPSAGEQPAAPHSPSAKD